MKVLHSQIAVDRLSSYRAPSSGWKCVLLGDTLLVEPCLPVPLSDSVLEVSAYQPGSIQAIVVQVSENCADRWKDVFRVGDRVVLSGGMTPVSFNGCNYYVVSMSNVECILRHESGNNLGSC